MNSTYLNINDALFSTHHSFIFKYSPTLNFSIGRLNAELQVIPPIFLAATPVGADTMTFFDIDGMLLLLYWRLIRSTRMHATKLFPVPPDPSKQRGSAE
jgi:hypothetical protein